MSRCTATRPLCRSGSGPNSVADVQSSILDRTLVGSSRRGTTLHGVLDQYGDECCQRAQGVTTVWTNVNSPSKVSVGESRSHSVPRHLTCQPASFMMPRLQDASKDGPWRPDERKTETRSFENGDHQASASHVGPPSRLLPTGSSASSSSVHRIVEQAAVSCKDPSTPLCRLPGAPGKCHPPCPAPRLGAQRMAAGRR